jgi:hypothetical protein
MYIPPSNTGENVKDDSFKLASFVYKKSVGGYYKTTIFKVEELSQSFLQIMRAKLT